MQTIALKREWLWDDPSLGPESVTKLTIDIEVVYSSTLLLKVTALGIFKLSCPSLAAKVSYSVQVSHSPDVLVFLGRGL